MTEQQRTRYLALKARMDRLTAGTAWQAHRGKGIQHIISYMQSRPQSSCCHPSAASVDEVSEEFAAPETFDDGADTSSSDSDDSCSSPRSYHADNGGSAQHDSSASSPIIYLSAPPALKSPTTPPPATDRRTDNNRASQLPSPILRTPGSERSSLNFSAQPPTSAASSFSPSTYTSSAKSPASNQSSISSHISADPTLRDTPQPSSPSSSLVATPVTANTGSQRQTLTVYWPWSESDCSDNSGHVSTVKNTPVTQQRQRREQLGASAASQEIYGQHKDAPVLGDEELEPGMPSRIATADLSPMAEQPGAPHPETKPPGALESLFGKQEAEEQVADEDEDEDSQQQYQLNSTASSFAVAASDEPSSDSTPANERRTSDVQAESQDASECADDNCDARTQDSAAINSLRAEVSAPEAGREDSPALPARGTAAKRRALVSDDEDESVSADEHAQSSTEPTAHADESGTGVESVLDLSVCDDSPVVSRRGGLARRRQIISDDDDNSEDVSTQRTVAAARLQSPLRDITNQRHTTSRPPMPCASPPAKPHPTSAFVFATPAPRPTRSLLPAASHYTHAVDGGRRTRSATRGVGRQGGDDGVGDEDEMDLYATPMIERIRQHKAALYNQQALEEEELVEADKDVEEKAESEDQDEYDQSFIASDGHSDASVESIGHDDDDGHNSDDDSPPTMHSAHDQPTRHNPSKRQPRLPPRVKSAKAVPRLPTLPSTTASSSHATCTLTSTATPSPTACPPSCPSSGATSSAPPPATAACCNWWAAARRRCIITLAAKVIDSYERLRKTLAHEMCHAAAWLIDGCNRPPHGRIVPPVRAAVRAPPARPHHLHVPHVRHLLPVALPLRAPHCAQEVGRHTDSLDVAVGRCGRCGGRLVRLGKFARDGTPVAVREATGFAAFVQAQQARVRAEHPGTPQRDVMGLLSAEWKRHREVEARAVADLAVAEREEEAGEDDVAVEHDLVHRMLNLDVVDE